MSLEVESLTHATLWCLGRCVHFHVWSRDQMASSTEHALGMKSPAGSGEGPRMLSSLDDALKELSRRASHEGRLKLYVGVSDAWLGHRCVDMNVPLWSDSAVSGAVAGVWSDDRLKTDGGDVFRAWPSSSSASLSLACRYPGELLRSLARFCEAGNFDLMAVVPLSVMAMVEGGPATDEPREAAVTVAVDDAAMTLIRYVRGGTRAEEILVRPHRSQSEEAIRLALDAWLMRLGLSSDLWSGCVAKKVWVWADQPLEERDRLLQTVARSTREVARLALIPRHVRSSWTRRWISAMALLIVFAVTWPMGFRAFAVAEENPMGLRDDGSRGASVHDIRQTRLHHAVFADTATANMMAAPYVDLLLSLKPPKDVRVRLSSLDARADLPTRTGSIEGVGDAVEDVFMYQRYLRSRSVVSAVHLRKHAVVELDNHREIHFVMDISW